MNGAHFKKTEFHGAWMDASDLKGARFEEAYAPSGKLIHGTIDSRTSSAELADKLQRRKPLPEMAKSPFALAYEQGCGPALLDRLEAAERLEASPEKGDKVSLADLRGKAQAEKAERQTTKDRDLER